MLNQNKTNQQQHMHSIIIYAEASIETHKNKND